MFPVEPFAGVPPHLIADGVRCISVPNHARTNARAKTTDWMHERKALTAAMPEGIYDTFLEDGAGYLLGGLGSNFYAIRAGNLYTADEGILHGISRQIVFEVAPDILPILLEPMHRDEIEDYDEAFLTSSSRGVIPVVEINGVILSGGKPGRLTMQLRRAYDAWTEAHLEEL